MFNESKESETGKFTQLEVNLPQAGNQKEPEIIDITPHTLIIRDFPMTPYGPVGGQTNHNDYSI